MIPHRLIPILIYDEEFGFPFEPAPTDPGLQYTLAVARLHCGVPGNPVHYSPEPGSAHFSLPEGRLHA